MNILFSLFINQISPDLPLRFELAGIPVLFQMELFEVSAVARAISLASYNISYTNFFSHTFLHIQLGM